MHVFLVSGNGTCTVPKVHKSIATVFTFLRVETDPYTNFDSK